MNDRSKPYLTEDGTLVIPGECSDNKDKWWKKEGRSLEQILTELGANENVWHRYCDAPWPGSTSGDA